MQINPARRYRLLRYRRLEGPHSGEIVCGDRATDVPYVGDVLELTRILGVCREPLVQA